MKSHNTNPRFTKPRYARTAYTKDIKAKKNNFLASQLVQNLYEKLPCQDATSGAFN